MAKTANTDDSVQAPPKTKTATAFSKAELIANAGALGTTPELLAGALATLNKETVTKQEAKDAVAAFKTRPVERSK